MDESCEKKSIQWTWFGIEYPRREIVFFSQIFIIYTVIVTSIFNLSFNTGNTNLWTVLLSSCLGYLLPNPSVSKDGSLLHNPTE